MSNLEKLHSSANSAQQETWVGLINSWTRHSVSEALARDEELGYEYLGQATSIYPENSLL